MGVQDRTGLERLQKQFKLMHGSPMGSTEHSGTSSPSLMSPASGSSLGAAEADEVASNPSKYLVEWFQGMEKEVGMQVPKEIETIIMRSELWVKK